jgi:NAD(P)-dependent dehydrogenase (short-subunit alcohol dehydrogenase family)
MIAQLSRRETKMAGRLEGKVAFITGAAMGMGREACLLFASEGAKIAGLDLADKELADTAAEVTTAGGEMLTIHADVSDEQQVVEAIQRTWDRFGALHVIYNNAGVLWRDRDFSVVKTELENWNRVMAINVGGPFLVCKHGIPRLIESGGGSVIITASVSALLGDDSPQDAYTASKGAVTSLTRSMAVTFAKDGVRVNAIHPGLIDTPMQAEGMKDPAWIEANLAYIPLLRVGTARDIANAALFLASDESSYMTGAEMIVDGGLMVV